MSEMTTHTTSDDTLIRDSQLNGFASFTQRLSYCCCRLSKRTDKYDFTDATKKEDETIQEKPSYINRAFQAEKQQRQEKLDKIARTLPNSNSTEKPISKTQPITTITQNTPRTGVGISQQKTQINKNPNSKATNDETSTDETTEDESSSSDDQSTDSDNQQKAKKKIINKKK